MKKKLNFIIITIIIVLILIICLIKINKSVKDNKEIKNENIETNLNNETGMYEVYNPITNEILTTTESEEGAKLETEFYKENPNYKAEPPVSPN
mgnify:FL=1